MLQIKFDARNQGHWIVMFAVLILGVSISSYLYSTDRYSLVYFGDSASHLLGARKIVDWMDPGLQQVGTVWLPLPHFLLLPFVLIDPMFNSGLAGTAVSLPSLAITVAILYRMVKTHLGEAAGYISFVAAMLYATNPNILYLGVTAMTEAPFMLFFVASAYYFQKWSADHLRVKNLVLCSIFVILATLCRYEGWILAAFLVPFVIFTSFKGNLDSKSKKVERILLSAISLLGIAAWIGYNAYQYGDPLEFANAQYYSASSQALDRSIRETLFLQPINVISIYGTTAFMIFGPVLLVAALTGYICHRRMQGSNSRRILYVYLALPPLFSIITILVGIGEMTYWFNSRFLILLSPLIILLTAVYLHNLPKKVQTHRGLTAVVVASLFAFQLATPLFAVVTYLDAVGGFFYQGTPYAVQTGEALRSIYDNGTIMTVTGSAQEHRIMLTSGIALRQYDEIIESSTWKQSFAQPWVYDRWFVISKNPDSDGVSVVKYWQERRSQLEEHYRLVYENEYHEILVLK